MINGFEMKKIMNDALGIRKLEMNIKTRYLRCSVPRYFAMKDEKRGGLDWKSG
jgi:hypothetical protein